MNATRFVVIAAVLGLTILPAAAIGAPPKTPPKTLWVSPAAVSVTPGSCAKPGYNTIQSAINAAPAGATIRVCAGTYVEQLQITQAVSLVGVGAVTVQLPAVPANSTTACDTAPGTGGFQPNQDGVVVCTTGVVNMTGLKINAAWPSATCDDSLYGVLVAGGATLNLTSSSIVAAGAVPLNGCQGGVGIQVGMAWTTPVEVGHANLSNDSVSGYQKNGVTVDGAGSSANVARTAVTGIGPTTQIAQNGIQVSNGASARISSSTISGDECNVAVCGANALTQTQSVGVLFFGAASGSSVTSSKINGNDIGVYNYEATAPTGPAVSVVGDTLANNRYEGVVLDQGSASVRGDTITGGNVGLAVVQYRGQAFAADGTASQDVIRGASVAAVQVSSDQALTGDFAGLLTISFSKLSGNAARVLNNSANYVVVQHANS